MSRSRILSSLAAATVGVLLLGACGGSSSPAETSQAEQSNEETGATPEVDDPGVANTEDPIAADAEDSLPPACGLLSIADVESVTGLVVIDVSGRANGDSAGVCEWEFEPLPESRGALAGTSPSILLQTFPDMENYNTLAAEPEALIVDGVGDGAITFDWGRLYFNANGRGAFIHSLLVFESGPSLEAGTQQLAALAAAGL